MKRWYFWVLAPVLIGMAGLMPLLLLEGNSSPSASQIVIALALSAWFLLATLGLANPTRFRWALIVDVAALGILMVYGILTDKSPLPPPMPADLRRAYDVVGGAVVGTGLLVALLDTISATLWAFGPRDRNHSQLLIAPLIFYVTGGWVLVRGRSGWRSAVAGLLFVVVALSVEIVVPMLAEVWVDWRRSASDKA